MNNWDCAECGTDTREEYFMVHDWIWEIWGDEPFLCIGCLEDRMGRELWSGDFTHWPVNNVNQWNKSDRLIDRLNRACPPRPQLRRTNVAKRAAELGRASDHPVLDRTLPDSA